MERIAPISDSIEDVTGRELGDAFLPKFDAAGLLTAVVQHADSGEVLMVAFMDRAARARALSGAIAVNPRRAAKLKGSNVVLVDDVMTSGATSDACVRALKRAGAERVVVACFARVLDEAL